jgi:hypothetical protein
MRVEQVFDAPQNAGKLHEQILEYARHVKVLEVRAAKARVS